MDAKWFTPQVNPSILAADFCCLGEQVRDAAAAGVQVIHIDVMDGRFVPNISIGIPIVKSLRPLADELGILLDVHLMIVEPERYIQLFQDAGADLLTVHAEISPHLHRTIQTIKEAGAYAGVALNPSTPLQILEEVITMLDLILIMTVNPGFGGQAYITSMTNKIARLRKMLYEKGHQAVIEVDGGVKTHNIAQIVDAGAQWLVSGSDVFNTRAPVAENIESLNQQIRLANSNIV
ncbi:MAG: ribulose-phosphate 3-epimerase [Chloroflexota bacterium]